MPKKDDTRKMFQSIALDEQEGVELHEGMGQDVLNRLWLEAGAAGQVSRPLSGRGNQPEKPGFMTSDALLLFHVDRPEQTGSSSRFMYYDSEITSIIRYAHCSKKFASSTMDIVRKELFPYNSAVAEEDIANVGMEWETTGLHIAALSLFVFFSRAFVMHQQFPSPVSVQPKCRRCKKKPAKNLPCSWKIPSTSSPSLIVFL